MNPRVAAVHPLPDYQLQLTFTNGEQGVFDCSSLLDVGVFQPLRDPRYFQRVIVRDGTVTWPDEQDLCPDTLYLDSIRHD